MSLPIRARLTIWYAVVVTILLSAFAAGVYAFVAAEERAAVDRILRERAESFERAYSGELREESGPAAIVEVARDYARGEGGVAIYDASGKIIFGAPPPLLSAPRPGIVTLGDTRCITARVGNFLYVSTESLSGRRRALTRLRDAFVVLIPAAILIAALCGYFLAARSLAPVARMTEAASRIEAENLSDRIATGHRDDELGRLAAVLNALLQRLERSFQQQKQLLADTSHELRTPAAIIRSEAEVTLSRDRERDDYRRALEVIRSESSHLSTLLDGVLLLARGDAQEARIEMAPLQLADIVNDSVQSLQRVAEARQISLTCETEAPMPLRGNAELLRRMLLNLADNAIKFTDSGGRVRVESRRVDGSYIIDVSDSGRGIPGEAQARIFDRFYRGDAARGRASDRDSAAGAGLGLPIAQWIARAHGGDVRLARSSSAGSTFEIVLPVSADAGES